MGGVLSPTSGTGDGSVGRRCGAAIEPGEIEEADGDGEVEVGGWKLEVGGGRMEE